MIRLMPEFGGEWTPEDKPMEMSETQIDNENRSCAETATKYLDEIMAESKDILFCDFNGVKLYHVVKTLSGGKLNSFSIYDIKGKRSYGFSCTGELIPSALLGGEITDVRPDWQEVMKDIVILSQLQKKPLS